MNLPCLTLVLPGKTSDSRNSLYGLKAYSRQTLPNAVSDLIMHCLIKKMVYFDTDLINLKPL